LVLGLPDLIEVQVRADSHSKLIAHSETECVDLETRRVSILKNWQEFLPITSLLRLLVSLGLVPRQDELVVREPGYLLILSLLNSSDINII
jgi:hypothetical protein